jgi:hypothetical protein
VRATFRQRHIPSTGILRTYTTSTPSPYRTTKLLASTSTAFKAVAAGHSQRRYLSWGGIDERRSQSTHSQIQGQGWGQSQSQSQSQRGGFEGRKRDEREEKEGNMARKLPSHSSFLPESSHLDLLH